MILGPQVGYTDILDYEIEQKIETDAMERKKKNPLRPSAAGFCSRRLAYDLAMYRGTVAYDAQAERLSPAAFRLFELGHAVEFAALKTFRLCKVIDQRYKQKILSFREIERGDPSLPKEILEGSCDFCFIHPEWKAIGDVKSKKDKFSQAYKTAWDEELEWLGTRPSVEQFSETAFWVDDLPAFLAELGDDFLTENLYQLNLYANSEFILRRGIDHAFLYRYNKNDSRHMEIRFRPSKEVYEATLQKLDRVSIAVDKGLQEEVPRDFVLGSARCAFCPHKGHCWPGDDALRAYFKTLPPKRWPQDLHKLEGQVRDDLTTLFANLESMGEAVDACQDISGDILKILTTLKITRIRLDNGNIYDVKYKKTPRPHFELKRSKL